ncbi:hypothetical protein IWX90DRAFT_63542 [Phyllosticta citrichinensis]|uniref:Uncharacterized protein n=1 Tax=Phyllosticta citrichinensis TaxID=1130410 RepID=A0ABR1XHA2_9PEZI
MRPTLPVAQQKCDHSLIRKGGFGLPALSGCLLACLLAHLSRPISPLETRVRASENAVFYCHDMPRHATVHPQILPCPPARPASALSCPVLPCHTCLKRRLAVALFSLPFDCLGFFAIHEPRTVRRKSKKGKIFALPNTRPTPRLSASSFSLTQSTASVRHSAHRGGRKCPCLAACRCPPVPLGHRGRNGAP